MRLGGSAFMAIGALLGFVVVRRDAEHVVALDADAVDNRLGRVLGLAFRLLRLAHKVILTYRGNLDSQACSTAAGARKLHRQSAPQKRKKQLDGGID